MRHTMGFIRISRYDQVGACSAGGYGGRRLGELGVVADVDPEANSSDVIDRVLVSAGED